ncbi:MAG: hydantoinase/oxoprolinase family protein [Herpetosiphon sp.]
MRIGIDVGGTHTDAVLMKHATVLGVYKTPTTRIVTRGITTALRAILAQARVPASEIDAVMIGTTHFTNAVVERQQLMPVGVVRLALPSTSSLPPMVDWPADLSAAIGNHGHLVHGGYEFNGRPIARLDEREIRAVAEHLCRTGIRSVAISSVFSPVNADMELRAAEIIRTVIPNVSISLSHEIGRIGLLERENAAILNACLQDLAGKIVAAFRRALDDLALYAPVYISQNDGTLMSASFAERYPVLTFASGPTNSMRGGAFLTGLRESIVVDIGGTTTNVGVLSGGFPREAAVKVQIAGVRSNLRMPEVHSVCLGGGSIVTDEADGLCIGPQSVGYELTRRALIFGGDVLTASDIAVAAELADLGDRVGVAHLKPTLVARALLQIQTTLAAAIDRMRISSEPLPVVIVGGGSILAQDRLPGISEIIVPEHCAVANAIGAAIAQISGETDRVWALAHISREDALDQARQEAIEKARSAGADAATIQVIDIEEVPLSYLPGNATRIRVKAVGDLQRRWPVCVC